MYSMKNISYILAVLCSLSLVSCSRNLDVEPRNKIPGEAVLSDPNGIRSFLANLYYQAPIEDFVYFPRAGFNARGNTGSMSLSQYSIEAIHSEWPNWNEFNNEWWDKGYRLNRSLNILMDAIPALKIPDNEKKELTGEVHFLRAYTYFGLAKRYGGVPIIDESQEYTTDFSQLRVPRSTEKQTWDFILAELDKAAEMLPASRSSSDETKRRATRWAALALKSRAALHAASIAKFWERAPLSGEAVSQNLVGIPAAEAGNYYTQVITAAEEIMSSGTFSLFRPTPANPQEAAQNYQALFVDPSLAGSEVIFLKGYGHQGGDLAHDYDGWNNPNQNAEGFPYRGRTNPVLELVDMYENYDNPGSSAPIITTENGQVSDNDGFDPNTAYRKFDSPDQIFNQKDARFFATVIFPHSTWKNTRITIQGGIVKPDGSLIDSRGSYVHNGITYHTYGAADRNNYSGFDGSADMTRSGFLLKKFMNESLRVTNWRQSTTDFMDLRYAEVLLNYAEAVVESGYSQNNAQQRAEQALNALRRRAAHMTQIPLSRENVRRERTVELAFENKNYWDHVRWREFHEIFANKIKTALIPMIDLRAAEPKYIFVRKRVPGALNNTFISRDYYKPIPGIANNGVVQNPQY